jgi:hypothetical protein
MIRAAVAFLGLSLLSTAAFADIPMSRGQQRAQIRANAKAFYTSHDIFAKRPTVTVQFSKSTAGAVVAYIRGQLFGWGGRPTGQFNLYKGTFQASAGSLTQVGTWQDLPRPMFMSGTGPNGPGNGHANGHGHGNDQGNDQ